MPITVDGCTYPSNAEFSQLQQDLFPRYAQGRLAFDILPFRTSESDQIVFDTPDIFRGLQNWRGLGEPTQRVRRDWNPYGTRCVVPPGYWGEHTTLDEEFLTRAAQPGSCASVIDITEQVVRRTQHLLERRYNRIEFNDWQALVFGIYEATNSSGQIVHRSTYNIQHVSASIPWSNFAASKPLSDFRQIRLRSRGTSARFDQTTFAYMNQVTFNCLAQNQNTWDVGKTGLTACCTYMGLDVVNQQFAAQGLPQIAIYDEGYVDDNDSFYPYIPDGKVVFIGKRPGNVPIGHYIYTRNVIGCSTTSGPWMMLRDSCMFNEVPRYIKIHDGHNGGPAIEYPRAIIVLDTGCTAANSGI